MLVFYIEFRYTDGWWNYDGAIDFSVSDFLELMYAIELSPFDSLDVVLANPHDSLGLELISHATAHAIRGQALDNSNYKINEVTDNAIFDYIGGSGSFWSIHDEHYKNGQTLDQIAGGDIQLDVANYIVQKALYPTDAEWRNGGIPENPVDHTHPYYWGNQSMRPGKPPIWEWGQEGEDKFGVWGSQIP